MAKQGADSATGCAIWPITLILFSLSVGGAKASLRVMCVGAGSNDVDIFSFHLNVPMSQNLITVCIPILKFR